ncbi:carbohydrate kinase family protein [Tessaracoccus coleopterorum]|uniref:hypothetical protein n=1 Tax=Tessaracoccus coleopterorum TaxID=2714950 RepID=UPI001E54FC6B|nr:hypothetical protein [Tessaracoccus coleopterorum]
MVRYTGRAPSGLILSRFPSVVIGDGRAEATVLGSGWGDAEHSASRVEWAKLHRIPAVVDADALYALPPGGSTAGCSHPTPGSWPGSSAVPGPTSSSNRCPAPVRSPAQQGLPCC